MFYQISCGSSSKISLTPPVCHNYWFFVLKLINKVDISLLSQQNTLMNNLELLHDCSKIMNGQCNKNDVQHLARMNQYEYEWLPLTCQAYNSSWLYMFSSGDLGKKRLGKVIWPLSMAITSLIAYIASINIILKMFSSISIWILNSTQTKLLKKVLCSQNFQLLGLHC